MPNTIGMAGRTHGNGRVAALSKAISTSDFTISGQGQDLLIQLFKNTLNWCINPVPVPFRGGLIDVFLHSTGNTSLDNIIQSLVSNIGYSCTIKPAWYKPQTISRCCARIIMPSYNANLGIRMEDNVQTDIMYNVYNYGEGLLLGEWFHLLQSMPTRRSFSLSTDLNEGLHTISPILLDLSKRVVFTTVDELLYIKTKENDSMSYTLPPSFSVGNISNDVDFGGHLSQLADIRDDAVVFWSTDVPAISNTTTTTTTTTTPAPVTSEKIKMKLFNVQMLDYCGPQNWYLDGLDKDKFSFDGKHVYLIKNLKEEQNLTFDIVAEDYFNPDRFNKRVQPVYVVARQCDAPITLPKNFAQAAYSWRGLPTEASHKKTWGENSITGVINNFSEWDATGTGTADDHKIAYLGGMHSDVNVLWLQLNNGGTVSGKLTTSLSSLEGGGSLSYDYADMSKVYYVYNTITDDIPTIEPYQHEKDIYGSLNTEKFEDNVNVQRLVGDEYGVTGKNNINSFTFNVEDPNELDSSGNRVRGDAYLVLILRKSDLRSEYDDRVDLEAWYGTIATTPPPVFAYNVFIINNVEGTTLSTNSLTFTSQAQNTPLESQQFTIYSDDGVGINSLSATDNSEILTVEVGTITTPVQSRVITVNLEEMPVNGGAATIILSGSTVTTTTTTPPPTYTFNVTVVNKLTKADVVTLYGQIGSIDYNESFINPLTTSPGQRSHGYVFASPDSGYEYVSPNRPSFSIISSTDPSFYAVLGNIDQTGAGALTQISFAIGSMPIGGGNATIHITPPEPTAIVTTTTTTTTTAEPCSNLIQIICRQTLVCIEDADGNCQASLPVSQDVIYSTCCDLDEATVLSIVRAANGAGATDTLQQIYASSCPPTTNTLLNPCQPKDQDGNCQETIHSVVIDEISCGSSDNPLP